MSLPITMASGKGEPAVLRGKIKSARFEVWEDGLLRYVDDFQLDKAPIQPNNMSEWLWQIMHNYKHSTKMIDDFREGWRGIRYEVNDGMGPKRGRGSNHNTFTYYFRAWKVELILDTELHQQAYARKVKSGAHVPQTMKHQTAPFISMDDGKIYAPMEMFGTISWISYSDHEEYYTEHPDHRGTLATLDIRS